MTAGKASTSFTIYDLLTRITPGLVFLIPLAAIVTQLDFGFLGNHPTYSGLAIILLSLIFGEIINGLRLSLLDVPNQFRRVLYSDTGNEEYLSWRDRITLAGAKWISENIHEMDSGLSTNSLFDYRRGTLIAVVNQRFQPSKQINATYDLYELIISDLSGNESRRTRRLRSVYIFQQNTQLALKLSAGIALIISLTGFAGLTNFEDTLVIAAFLVFFLLFIIHYFLTIFINSIASIDRIYIESLLSDYYTYISRV